jgi:RHS repeat-associated protein
MRGFLPAILLMLPAMQAGNLDADLTVVRQRLGRHPAAQRRLSGLQRRATLMHNTLGETAAALERLEEKDASGRLVHMRERLLAANGSLEQDFAAIEAKLSGLGLPEKLEAWRKYAGHYRARAAEVEAELSWLAAHGGELSSEQFRSRAEALRAKLGAGAEGRRHESVHRLSARLTPAETAPATMVAELTADEAPTAADLAESKVVVLTPEIRAKAAAMVGDAAALYNWVATHVEYFPALGHMQNSQAVLTSGRGNDLDQATLLIALLRASGIAARYVSADVVMPRADVREWMGVKDETLVVNLLSRSADFQLFSSVERDRVVATRAWVEAYVDAGAGKRWLTMDPARKRRSFQPGIVLERPVYDRMAYLRALKPIPPGEAYLDALRAEFQKRYPGRGFDEAPFKGSLLPPGPPAPEQPYPLVKLHFRASETPASTRHRIRLTLTNAPGQTTYLNLDLTLPEVILQSLTLSFNPATASDRLVAQAFGGIEDAPAAAVNLLPEFRLDDQVIATGKTPVPLGTILDLSVNHAPPVPAAVTYVNTNHHFFTAGETAAVLLGAHLVSDELLAGRISRFLSRLPTASTAEATRLLLDTAAVRYLHRVELDEERLSGPMQVRFYPDDEVGNAITFASLEPKNLFDRPFVVTPGRLQIHAWPTCLPFIDLNRSDHSDPVIKTSWQLHNDAISALEHEVWEELVMIPSVSTIKILQAAIRDNVPIRVISPANAATELRGMETPQAIRDALAARIMEGATLTVPQRPITIGSWRGTGWIEEYPDWNYNYIIYDFALLSPGGDTGGAAPQPQPPQNGPGTVGSPGPLNNTTCSDPVNVANGNLFEQTTDYALGTQGPGIVFQRIYNSLLLADGPLGMGWRHSYQVSLKDTGSSIVVQDGSGTLLNFRQASGGWVSPPGYHQTLIKDAQGYVLRTRNGLESRFDLRGNLVTLTDRNQNTIQFTYEADRLRRMSDRAGRGVTLSYDGRGRLTALEDFTGRRVTYEYDAAGRLTGVTNAAGNRTSYAYYADRIFNHLLRSITTPEGRVTGFQYYGNGRVAKVTLPGGQVTSFLYLPLRNETHVIDPRGLLTSYQFNGLGNVVRIVRPDGNYIDRVYNNEAKLEAETDAGGFVTRYTYDTAGNLTAVTDPQGRTMRFTYDPKFNLVTSIRDAAGATSQFEYDGRGNLTRSVGPLGEETRFNRDSAGNLISRTDAEGNTVTISYDEVGNPIAIRDALGNVTKLEYDRLKRAVRAIGPEGGEVRREYDAQDRPVWQADPTGRAAAMTYDRDGRLVRATDHAGRVASFRYDALNQLSQVTDALNQVTEYGYAAPDCGCTAAGNLTTFRDAGGLVSYQAFDFLDRLTAVTDALGNTTEFGYDARGNLSWKRDANGNVSRMEHDAAGHVTRRIYSDGSEARFAFDENNNLVSASNQHVTYTFTYDAARRLKSFTDSRFNKTLSYTYDRLGRRTTLVDSEGGVFKYNWDAKSRMVSVENPAGATAAFRYDAAGRRNGLAYSNGVTAEYQYDAAGRLTALAQGGAASAYGYDAAGNVTSITEASGTHVYEYDLLDRLVAAAHPSLPAETYRYDALGNRLASAGDSGYVYGAAGRLASAEGAAYTYDKSGNLTGKTTTAGASVYRWDSAGQLARIDFPDGGLAEYKYDPFGRRIEKNANGSATAYLYDLSTILLELDPSGAMVARYTHGPGVDQPLMMERGGQTYFYHQDRQSDVVQLTDASGTAVCTYGYDSFGRTQPCPDLVNPYEFAGREYDVESGLYHMRARYYDPAVGRFISPDPLDLANLVIGERSRRAAQALLPAAAAALAGRRSLNALRSPKQLNPYAYALNNPVAFRDPSGLSCTIHVQIGWEMNGQGANATGEFQFEGNINNFNHWLEMNHYSLSYTEGGFAAITDMDTGQVVGTVSASAAGFQEVPYQETPSMLSGEYWQMVGQGLIDVGQHIANNFQASFQVPWHQLHGQQYWDAMNNPQQYAQKLP